MSDDRALRVQGTHISNDFFEIAVEDGVKFPGSFDRPGRRLRRPVSFFALPAVEAGDQHVPWEGPTWARIEEVRDVRTRSVEFLGESYVPEYRLWYGRTRPVVRNNFHYL